VILSKLNINNLTPFGYYKGNYSGYYGEINHPITRDIVYQKLKINPEHSTFLNFGKDQITRIAVVTGSGGHYFNEAIELGVDLFITGDNDHTLYHPAKENQINVLFAGHYYTETFGIKALMEKIGQDFPVETIFLDIPTNL
ncbi:MAG: Nif3-like dinuclear metal center hexameric protein, partial [Spirochaetes bacterium]|nr:Nif3-like dinuclear metal center hexameric protein [Spirochaetota bacterium]